MALTQPYFCPESDIAIDPADIKLWLYGMYGIEHFLAFWHVYSCYILACGMNYSDEHIKTLCARALTASEDELEAILVELRIAVREHALKVENELYSYPVLRRDPQTVLS